MARSLERGDVTQEPTEHMVFCLRLAIDCTINGITSEHEWVFDSARLTKLDQSVRIISWYGYYKACPVDSNGQPNKNGMFGGNYITSSDSRWKEKYPHPIPVHDRFER